jgi:hypothetical protein
MLRSKKRDKPGLITVHTAFGLLPAQVIKTKLESAGIPALLDYESAGVVLGITVDGLGEVRVMVPESLAEEARVLLAGEGEESVKLLETDESEE